MQRCREIISQGLTSLNMTCSEQQLDCLVAFAGLIQKWNKTYNLTAIKNERDIARLHLLDSLAVQPHLYGERIADIGTGAGLPGIPLAVFCPHIQFTLLDSNSKKTRFVQQAVLELGLKNVQIEHARVEQFHPTQLFSTVIMRAFADLEKIMGLTSHLLDEQGVVLAMKANIQAHELASVVETYDVIPLEVPGLDVERCLIKIQRQTDG